MKFSAPARVLSNAIALPSAISLRANSPVVAQLAATGAAVSIRCTENTMGTIATGVPALIAAPGETVVSLGRLAALVAGFAADAVLEIEATGHTLSVVSGTSRLRLPIVPVTDLPLPIATDQEIGRVEISRAECLKLLEPLAAAEEARSRFYLAGVFLQSLDDQLVAVATDGVRLIRTSVAASTFSEDGNLIVPTEVAIALRRVLQKSPAANVVLRRSRTLIAFEASEFCFTARLVDAGYPAYERLIPPPSSNSVVCDRLNLLAVVLRLSAAAPSIETALVALSWGQGSKLELHLARCPLDGADVVAAEVHGSAEVALSLPQLLALLKEFSSVQIQLETANGQPVVIRGAGNKLALIVRSYWNFDSRREVA
ncbi:DNA polymerase III subunit beta family protein [Bradyrhizobium sp. AZCC 2289]|uniref:DNA polymerase III subunit beta family protein n=1 Tax=Bradyrhizobium sp. AZCC 2289 TaxID=3117026 RepID=UPI002FF373F6